MANGRKWDGDARLLFPTEYIAAADLRGRDVNLTIDAVLIEGLKVDRGTEHKPVLTFREMIERNRRDPQKPNKRLVMNKTNMKLIGKALGSYETNDWVGRQITLYPTTCQAFGETVDCVRVRERAPQQANPVPDDGADDMSDEGLGL